MRRALAVGVLALALVAAAATLPLPVAAHVNDVNLDPQVSADGTVLVETAFVAGDGWVVLHADDGGDPGEALDAMRLSGEDGFTTDLRLQVPDERWRDWDAGEARPVHVALHNDDGDGRFEPDDDPVLTFFGRAAAERVTLARGDTSYVSTKQFAPLETGDRTLRVRRVRLPADGHLVARNVTTGPEGEAVPAEPVGATALDAGAHGNVSVRLDGSFYARQGSRFRLAFTAYRDDGDGTFGSGDEPVRAGEAAVGTTVFVNRTDATGTATPGGAGGTGVTTASPTAGEGGDGALVTTASPSPEPTPTTPGTRTGDSPAGDGAAAGTTTGGQPGFGVLAAVGALLAGLLAAARANGPKRED
jgi:hypothetical protein